MTKRWLGTTKCDLCQSELTKEQYFVDCLTTSGRWALLCPMCFRRIGKNVGQKYGPDTKKLCDLHENVA